MTAAKDGVLIRRRLRIFAAAVALVLLCAVCVGGVSGATHYVYANHNLADIVDNANDGDEIVIMEDYVIKEQVVLSSKRVQTGSNWWGQPTYSYISRTITITNAPGVDVTISSNLGGLSSSDNTVVDTRTLFKIHAGKLIVKGNDLGGSLSFTSNYKGRVFDVNFDEIKSGNEDDGLGATLEMYEGVRVYQSGFTTENIAKSNNGGAVYIRNQGRFIMHGGLLSENKAGGGGAVCVDNGGYFELNGGLISNNNALYTRSDYQNGGGGVWAYDKTIVKWTGGEIKGNTASAQPPAGKDYNEIYPEIDPPVKTESPIYVKYDNSKIYDGYWSIKEAYDDMKKRNVKTFTIHIRRDFSQGYIEKWQNNAYVTDLDKVTIENSYSVTIKPDTTSITLHIVYDQMFIVSSGGSLTVSGNNGASLTISGKNEVNTVETGGFVLVNGGSFEVQNGVTISSTKAKNGGAIYLKSGSCTLSGSASITGCAASGNGGAVYVADGTFTVKDSALITGCTSSGNGGAVYVADGMFTVKGSASVDASNDVYLEDGEVITAEIGYNGTVGKITLPEYNHGTRVVYIGNDKSGYPDKFSMNQEGMTNGFERLLEIGDDSSKEYLVLVNTDVLIVIPSELIIIKEDDENKDKGSMIIEARVLHIPKKASVFITVDSLYDFTLAYLDDRTDVVNPDISLEYILSLNGNSISDNEKVTAFTMSNPERRTLFAEVQESPLYAGEYVDTLTFIVRYDSGNYN